MFFSPFFLRGYTAPEYILEWYLTLKCDVYSFGVILLEIVNGQRNRSSPTFLSSVSTHWEPEILQDMHSLFSLCWIEHDFCNCFAGLGSLGSREDQRASGSNCGRTKAWDPIRTGEMRADRASLRAAISRRQAYHGCSGHDAKQQQLADPSAKRTGAKRQNGVSSPWSRSLVNAGGGIRHFARQPHGLSHVAGLGPSRPDSRCEINNGQIECLFSWELDSFQKQIFLAWRNVQFGCLTFFAVSSPVQNYSVVAWNCCATRICFLLSY